MQRQLLDCLVVIGLSAVSAAGRTSIADSGHTFMLDLQLLALTPQNATLVA